MSLARWFPGGKPNVCVNCSVAVNISGHRQVDAVGKNPDKFLGCQYCHRVPMQNEVVWQSVSLAIWLQMKMSSAIKFHARVSALCTHQSANDISRIFFFSVLVNMLAEICGTLLLPSVSVHGFFSAFKHTLILPKYLPTINLWLINRIALEQRWEEAFYSRNFLS